MIICVNLWEIFKSKSVGETSVGIKICDNLWKSVGETSVGVFKGFGL